MIRGSDTKPAHRRVSKELGDGGVVLCGALYTSNDIGPARVSGCAIKRWWLAPTQCPTSTHLTLHLPQSNPQPTTTQHLTHTNANHARTGPLHGCYAHLRRVAHERLLHRLPTPVPANTSCPQPSIGHGSPQRPSRGVCTALPRSPRHLANMGGSKGLHGLFEEVGHDVRALHHLHACWPTATRRGTGAGTRTGTHADMGAAQTGQGHGHVRTTLCQHFMGLTLAVDWASRTCAPTPTGLHPHRRGWAHSSERACACMVVSSWRAVPLRAECGCAA